MTSSQEGPAPPSREASLRGHLANLERIEREFAAFREERRFFAEVCGMDDRQIAERLGIEWTTYRSKFRRHPELGPINDPVERSMRELAGWSKIAYQSPRPRRN